MGDMLESIYMTVVSTVSLVGMFFILYLIMRATTSRWREFEALYPARDAAKPVFTVKAGAIRIAQPGFRFGHLSGDLKSRVYPPVTFDLYAEGLSLSVMPPFKYGCRDLFLPFAKMTVEPAPWTIGKGDYGLRMEGVEGIEIQVYSTTIAALSEHSEVLRLMVKRADLLREQRDT